MLDARSVSLTSSPKTKSEALDQAVALMTKSGKINDEEAYRSQVYAREEESTTGIGEGIAIPHGKCDAVSRPGLAAMVFDCSAKHKRQCAFGCVKQAVCYADG